MAYFAELVDDTVTQVIVVNDDIADGAQFCHDLLGGLWLETFIDDPDKNYAGIGYAYNPVTNDFIPPQPFESWTLDSNDIWQPPVPQPPPPPQTVWNEQLQEWVPREF